MASGLDRGRRRLIPCLLLGLALTPYGPLRYAGWLGILIYALRDYAIPLRLLVVSLPFTALGSFRLWFTLKPFQILLGLSLAALAVAAWRQRLPARRRTALDWPLAALALVMLVSLANSDVPAQSARLFINYLLLIIATLVFTGWYPERDLDRVHGLIVLGAAAMAPFQLAAFFLDALNRKGIALSPLEGGYATGDYLDFAIPFVVFWPAPNRLFRWLKLLLVSALLVDLVLTFSRGAWYGLGFGILFVILLRPRLLWRGRYAAGAAALILAGALIGMMIWSPYLTDQLLAYVQRKANPSYILAGGWDLSRYRHHLGIRAEYWRLYVWQDSLETFFRPHWFLGSGIGRVGLPAHDPPTHSNPVQILCELGVLGLAAWGWIWMVVCRRIRGWLALTPNSGFALACAASLVALLAHGLVFNTLVWLHNWLILGFAVLAGTRRAE